MLSTHKTITLALMCALASTTVLTGCKLEAALADALPGTAYQFMRTGYFCADSRDSRPGALVFNRAVSLKDSFKPGK